MDYVENFFFEKECLAAVKGILSDPYWAGGSLFGVGTADDAINAQVKLLTLGYEMQVQVTRQVELDAFTAEYGFDFV